MKHDQKPPATTKKCLWCVDFDCGHCIDVQRARVNYTVRICPCSHSQGVTDEITRDDLNTFFGVTT